MVRFSHARQAGRGSPSRLLEAILVLAAAVGIFWIGLLTYRQVNFDEELALATVTRTNEARVQGFEQFVLRTIETADLATRHIEANLEEINSGQFSVATEPVLSSKVFDAFVVHSTGRPPIFSGTSPVPGETVKQLDEYASRSRRDLIITPPVTVGSGRQQVAALRKFNGDTGYVAVLMDADRFTDFAQNIPFTKDDLISLIGLDGITRARRTGNKLSAGEPVRGLVMQRQLADPNGTYVGPSVLDGIPRIFSHRRLADYDLFATSGTPLTAVNERVASRRTFQLFAALAGILAISAAAAAAIVYNRRRHQRMIELEDANARLIEAQRIGAIGDWDYYPKSDRLYWSDNLRAMYGRGVDEAISTLSDVKRHIAPEDAAMLEREIGKISETGEPRTWEFNAVLADGSTSARRVVAAPILNAEGEIIGIHGTDQDISHVVQSREMESRLSEIARLESVNSLAATLAHELNQPLGVTANYLGAVQRLLDEGGPNSKVRQYLEASQDQLHHVSAIIAGARDLVTPGKVELEEVDIQEAVESVMVLMRGYAGRRAVNYRVEIAGNVSTIWTNGAQFKQVLFNLARNGIEAIPDERDPQIFFRAVRSKDGNAARVDVGDNGAGLQANFDPFAALNTTKSSGLGLGLSLSRTIVEAHGGKIWIEKTDGSGTTVSFTIGERH